VLAETTGKKRDRSWVYQRYLDKLRVGRHSQSKLEIRIGLGSHHKTSTDADEKNRPSRFLLDEIVSRLGSFVLDRADVPA
jgi:hypothetical protein